jgi:DNA-binding LacI/PurR family transcriptional regulator
VRRADAHYICFSLGYHGANPGTPVSAQQGFYRFASRRSLHGLFVLSAATFDDQGAEFVASRGRLPMVSLGSKLPGVPGVWVHSGQGVKALLEHLVRQCGRQRIGFIRGRVANAEADERFVAYTTYLAEHALPSSPRWVAGGDYSLASGASALQAILANSHRERPDAIVCANDLMALGALRALRSRGFRVPEDVAVVGFDDLEGELAAPGLTTIRQPVFDMGQKAVAMLLSAMRGEAVPDRVPVPATLSIRESCGAPWVEPRGVSSISEQIARSPFASVGRQVDLEVLSEANNDPTTLAVALRCALEAKLPKEDPLSAEASRLTDALELSLRRRSEEVAGWREYATATRHTNLEDFSALAEGSPSLPELRGGLTRCLRRVGTDGFYVVVLRRDAPNMASLFYGYSDGASLSAVSEPYPDQQLLPLDLFDSQPASNWLVQPFELEGELLGATVSRGPDLDPDFQARLGQTLARALRRAKLV